VLNRVHKPLAKAHIVEDDTIMLEWPELFKCIDGPNEQRVRKVGQCKAGFASFRWPKKKTRQIEIKAPHFKVLKQGLILGLN